VLKAADVVIGGLWQLVVLETSPAKSA
jgi:hypothetical protein